MICNLVLGQLKELKPLLVSFIKHDITKHKFVKTRRIYTIPLLGLGLAAVSHLTLLRGMEH